MEIRTQVWISCRLVFQSNHPHHLHIFVIRCLYSAVRLTLVREQRFIRIIIIMYFMPSCSVHGLFFIVKRLEGDLKKKKKKNPDLLLLTFQP